MVHGVVVGLMNGELNKNKKNKKKLHVQ